MGPEVFVGVGVFVGRGVLVWVGVFVRVGVLVGPQVTVKTADMLLALLKGRVVLPPAQLGVRTTTIVVGPHTPAGTVIDAVYEPLSSVVWPKYPTAVPEQPPLVEPTQV